MSSNVVRIIGGKWKGRKLRFPDREDLRPSLGRTRTTVFNWLLPYLPGARCLDLFAGSGALGIEAVSRGAAHCTLVERDAKAAAALRATLAVLATDALVVEQIDALLFLRRCVDARWDVVFLDPPFQANLLEATLEALRDHLNPEARVYFEAAAPLQAAPAGYSILKSSRAGEAHFGLLAPL